MGETREELLAAVIKAGRAMRDIVGAPPYGDYRGKNWDDALTRYEFAALAAAQPGLSEGQVRAVVERICKATGGISPIDSEGNPLSAHELEAKLVSWGKAGWNEYERLRRKNIAASQATPQEPPPTTPVSTEADAGTMKDGIFTPVIHTGERKEQIVDTPESHKAMIDAMCAAADATGMVGRGGTQQELNEWLMKWSPEEE